MAWCFKISTELPAGILGFTESWPLMSPSDVLFVVLTYLAFVVKIGPILMEGRRPFDIRKFLVVFNMIKVINSGYLTCKFLLYIADKGLFPQSCDHDKVTIYTIAALYWKFMATKVVDLLDTVFCVLRKKYSQITFLHVYHHSFMVLMSWACLKYDPSDHWAFLAVVNCGIHTAMYAYYAIAAMGPGYAKYLWWKQYLTIMQMIQFISVFAHVVIQASISSCPMRQGTYWIGLANLTLFLGLFSDFYNRRYLTHDATAKKNIEFACMTQESG